LSSIWHWDNNYPGCQQVIVSGHPKLGTRSCIAPGAGALEQVFYADAYPNAWNCGGGCLGGIYGSGPNWVQAQEYNDTNNWTGSIRYYG
jgi:hypothetical protein